MEKLFKFIPVIALSFVAYISLTSCETPTETVTTPSVQKEFVDYASSLKLDMGSSTAKANATIKNFVDGDTTHFYVSKDVVSDGVFKARYLAVNTPESTGRIDEYGKAAAKFTRSKLESAESIILESDSSKWEKDSSGSRIMSWVWYRTSPSSDYRNLNLEILQNGYGKASSTLQNRYGQICYEALQQAKDFKFNLYSGEKDPEYFYGEAVELTLKELRLNIASYNGMKVAFNGVITKGYNNSIYLEEYDSETGLYFGITVYMGYSSSGEVLKRTKIGMEVRMVGSLQYYETGGTYQISDVQYKTMEPNHPNNVQVISENNKAAYVEIDPKTFNSKVIIENNEELQEFDYGFLTMNTSVSMKNLDVVDVYTTIDESSSSYGAMTLTCKSSDGEFVSVRTVVLYDENDKVVTEDAYRNKNINIKGHVDCYEGKYQIKVFSIKDISIN